jgi:hypothetical protein
MLSWFCIIFGALGVLWVLNDIFRAVLVPRAIDDEWRVSVVFARTIVRTFSRVALSIRSVERREEFLGSAAPLGFVLLIAVWLFCLTFFFGLILYGVRDQFHPEITNFGTALFVAGATIFSANNGFYSIAPGARTVTLLASASGIGTVAITIAFLFLVIGSFQQRERFVVILDSRAGAPPSGLALLETYKQLGIMPELGSLFRASEDWIADVLNSHLAYPILMSFRSSHRDESWVAALGALLDAAALLVTVIEGVPQGEARLLLDVGMHLAHDLASYFILPGASPPNEPPHAWDLLRERLRNAGFAVRDDPSAWSEFCNLRATYASPLEGIGKRWLMSTAGLLGERTALPGHGS